MREDNIGWKKIAFLCMEEVRSLDESSSVKRQMSKEYIKVVKSKEKYQRQNIKGYYAAQSYMYNLRNKLYLVPRINSTLLHKLHDL